MCPCVVYVAYECGSVTYYCPAGSSYPVRVTGGYYSVGGGNSQGNVTRTSQTSTIKYILELYCTNIVFLRQCVARLSNSCSLNSSSLSSGKLLLQRDTLPLPGRHIWDHAGIECQQMHRY